MKSAVYSQKKKFQNEEHDYILQVCFDKTSGNETFCILCANYIIKSLY